MIAAEEILWKIYWRKWRYWRYRQKRQDRHAKIYMAEMAKVAKNALHYLHYLHFLPVLPLLPQHFLTKVQKVQKVQSKKNDKTKTIIINRAGGYKKAGKWTLTNSDICLIAMQSFPRMWRGVALHIFARQLDAWIYTFAEYYCMQASILFSETI